MSAEPSPIERVEALYLDLVAHYGRGEERERRAATKLLSVALARLAENDPDGWLRTVEEFVTMARVEPERFARVLEGGRRRKSM